MRVEDLIASLSHVAARAPGVEVVVGSGDECGDVSYVSLAEDRGIVRLVLGDRLVTDHRFVGPLETFCNYPRDHWHPDDRSEATEKTSEVCGLPEHRHVRRG